MISLKRHDIHKWHLRFLSVNYFWCGHYMYYQTTPRRALEICLWPSIFP